ncbi:hypothetical protein E1B28_005617 [Marasmius oreades]|uniref:Uncharacterized protein n=1 Tax=Marasmius oreades TaxID=181124 RepID=A0A9P7UUR9_9AGAR|nr:uncharacterized protein E1B28_005617 [Marasmius oreades]KAG7094803.1 hypothetical protein E1B28_005617 [Marasmius oreades]
MPKLEAPDVIVDVDDNEDDNKQLPGPELPKLLLESLKIPSDTSVSTLLDIPRKDLPTRPNSRKYFLETVDWFTNEQYHRRADFIARDSFRCISVQLYDDCVGGNID